MLLAVPVVATVERHALIVIVAVVSGIRLTEPPAYSVGSTTKKRPRPWRVWAGAFLRHCSSTWTRTKNLRINSALLCQLSYRGMLKQRAHFTKGIANA